MGYSVSLLFVTSNIKEEDELLVFFFLGLWEVEDKEEEEYSGLLVDRKQTFMQFVGQQHRGAIPAVGMAFPGYVGQPRLTGWEPQRLTWCQQCYRNDCKCEQGCRNAEITAV